MSLLQLNGVTKSYDFKEILRGVDLTIGEGDRIGLLGRNGAGKSTLLRILAGVEAPDEGERAAKKELELGVLEQVPALDPELTARAAVRAGLRGREELLREIEALHQELAAPGLAAARLDVLLRRQGQLEERLEELGGHDVEHRVEELLLHLGLRDPEARCATLSGGEGRRVALARLLIGRPDLLLLDEPTNHLDALVIDWLEDFLLESRVPLLLVTHDRYFLDRVVDRIVELEHGRLTEYAGNYSVYLVKKSERDAAAAHAEGNRQNLLRRETAWARRGPPARTTKSKARMDRYHALLAAAPDAPPGTMEMALPAGPRLGDKVVRVERAGKSFGGRVVVPPLELDLQPGERLGIVGPNGAGKTTLLRLMTGELAPDSGRVIVGETVKFATIDQHRTALDPDKSVLEEVGAQPGGVVRSGETLVRVEGFLDRFLFPGPSKRVPIRQLSGGERNRVLLAKLLVQAGNVIVLDEPTNDLDLPTLRALEEALIAFPGSLLIVSHDRWFLDRVATRIVQLDGEGGARQHAGDLSSLLERLAAERVEAEARERAERERRAKAAATKPAGATGSGDAGPGGASTSAKRKRTWREQQEYDALPDQIAAAERELAALDARFADPAFYSSPRAEIDAAQKRRADLAATIDALYTRWTTLD